MDRNLYDEELREFLPDFYLDNFTDFTDSTCFTYFIGCGDTKFSVGSESLNSFLRSGNIAIYVKMQISVVKPVICVQFFKYTSPTSPEISDLPFNSAQKSAYSAICSFAEEHGFSVENYSELVSKGKYDCLFESV